MNKVLKRRGLLSAFLMAASVSTMLTLSAYAFDGAVLSEIEINPYFDNSYQITLRTDKTVPVHKFVSSDSEIILDLKNTKPARFVNTIYNNATKVDHVIVQPISNSRVRILLQGSNMASSKINLDTISPNGGALNLQNEEVTNNAAIPSPVNANQAISSNVSKTPVSTAATAVENTSAPVAEQSTNQASSTVNNAERIQDPIGDPIKEEEVVVVRRPINSFKPLAVEDESSSDLQNEDTASWQSVLSSGLFQRIFSSSNLDWLLRFGMLALLIIGGFKLFRPKNQNVKIDLAGDLRSREIDLIKTLNERRGLIGNGLKEDSRAAEIAKKPGYGSVSRYGIKEYQNSQTPQLNSASFNPATSKIKSERRYSKPPEPEALARTPAQRTAQKTISRAPSVPKITQNDMNTAKVNIDSKKFLETMANIYEKSGRVDLAKGIQSNILKSKAM